MASDEVGKNSPDKINEMYSTAATSAAEDVDAPNGNFIEIGAESDASYVHQYQGHNSPEHNKTAEELLEIYEQEREKLKDAVSAGLRRHLDVSPE